MEYNKLKERIKNKQEFIDKHRKILNDLLAQCPHEETVIEESYFDGSYFDRASTTIYTKCALCGKLLHTKTKEHSWYG